MSQNKPFLYSTTLRSQVKGKNKKEKRFIFIYRTSNTKHQLDVHLTFKVYTISVSELLSQRALVFPEGCITAGSSWTAKL